MTAYDLPDWAGLALALADGGFRNRLDALLRLHHHLSRVVLSSKEPALIQMRLAWWREELRKPSDVGQADPLLGALKKEWSGDVAKVVAIVDAWEGLLADRPWPDTVIEALGLAYGNAFASMAGTKEADAARTHGRCWASAELRLAGYENALGQLPRLPKLSRNLRSLALIGGLSRRALSRPEMALLGDRLSPLAAMRLGIFGR